MDATRLDAVSRFFARRGLSRRQALAQAGAGLTAFGLTAAGVRAASAQESDAIPPVRPEGHPGGTRPLVAVEPLQTSMLFVQSYQAGSIAPKAGEEGRFTVTLDHGLGQTIYFSDRPERIVGATPTERFLGTLGFSPENPPNAALVLETTPGTTEFAVVELFAPVYDPAGPGVTYDVQVLAEWEKTLDLGFQATPVNLAALAPTFGAAHLLIDGLDDCPDGDIVCMGPPDQGGNFEKGRISNSEHDGFCRSAYWMSCLPCTPWITDYPELLPYWAGECNRRFASCGGRCQAQNLCTRGIPDLGCPS